MLQAWFIFRFSPQTLFLDYGVPTRFQDSPFCRASCRCLEEPYVRVCVQWYADFCSIAGDSCCSKWGNCA